jgi:hypothetical protein
MIFGGSRVEVVAIRQGDDLVMGSVDDLVRALTRGKPADVVEVEDVQRVKFGRREEHARARGEA